MDNRFEPLSSGEVLSVDESAQILIGHRTFRVGEFAEAIRTQLEYGINGWTQYKDAWFSPEGIPCEVLRFTANGWQKGKVRISLEFCPLDPEDENQKASASVENKSTPASVPQTTEDLDEDLDFEESPLSSASVDHDLPLAASVATSSLVVEEELVFVEPSVSIEDELEFGASDASDWELEQEAPNEIYSEMEQEAATIADDELYMAQMPTSLDDDFDLGEISQSIEQELELVEPTANDDDLLDLAEMPGDSDDDLDFGELSVGSEDDFQFEEISLNNDTQDEEGETDSLLDDVWQDMNEASWQNNP